MPGTFAPGPLIQERITAWPARTRVTPGPNSRTQPLASCPRQCGKYGSGPAQAAHLAELRVTHAAEGDLHEDLARLERRNVKIDDFERPGKFNKNGGGGFHGVVPVGLFQLAWTILLTSLLCRHPSVARFRPSATQHPFVPRTLHPQGQTDHAAERIHERPPCTSPGFFKKMANCSTPKARRNVGSKKHKLPPPPKEKFEVSKNNLRPWPIGNRLLLFIAEPGNAEQ